MWRAEPAPVASQVLRKAAEGALIEPSLSVRRLPAAGLGTRSATGVGQGRSGRCRRDCVDAAGRERTAGSVGARSPVSATRMTAIRMANRKFDLEWLDA